MRYMHLIMYHIVWWAFTRTHWANKVHRPRPKHYLPQCLYKCKPLAHVGDWGCSLLKVQYSQSPSCRVNIKGFRCLGLGCRRCTVVNSSNHCPQGRHIQLLHLVSWPCSWSGHVSLTNPCLVQSVSILVVVLVAQVQDRWIMSLLHEGAWHCSLFHQPLTVVGDTLFHEWWAFQMRWLRPFRGTSRGCREI